jgi:cell division protein FtsW (lipid II flippase)
VTTAVKRRRSEFGLLLVVAGLVVAAYTLVSLGRTASVPGNLRPFVAVILGLFLCAHLATRRFARHADPALLPIAVLLNGIGYVFIARLEPRLANKQAAWTAVGIVAYGATLGIIRNVRRLEHYRYTLALLGTVLLLAPLAPGIGTNINGSRIWVRLGPLSFQPGELAKLSLAVFFASYLVEKRELLAGVRGKRGRLSLPDLRHFGPILAAWAVSLVVLIAERDLGSSLLFFALFVSMLWVATARGAYLVIGSMMFAVGAFISWASFSHVQNRVRVWLNPWPTADRGGFQIVQSLYALGTGGLVGTGLALGDPTRIPYSYSDFIFAAIGEELGLAGTTAVLVLFLILVGSGLRIALAADSPFEKLLATGLTTILGFQTFIIVGGVTRLVPLTGVTLPFMSYGGSSLVVNYVIVALLVRISHNTTARQQTDGNASQRQRRRRNANEMTAGARA